MRCLEGLGRRLVQRMHILADDERISESLGIAQPAVWYLAIIPYSLETRCKAAMPTMFANEFWSL